jgi:hypothetical protein
MTVSFVDVEAHDAMMRARARDAALRRRIERRRQKMQRLHTAVATPHLLASDFEQAQYRADARAQDAMLDAAIHDAQHKSSARERHAARCRKQ